MNRRHATQRTLIPPTLCIVALLFAGCTSIVKTELRAGVLPGGENNCGKNAYSYFLPKRLLKITVNEREDLLNDAMAVGGKRKLRTLTIDEETISAPDSRHALCLQYQPSDTSIDELGVVRDANGLLLKVSSKAEEESGAVIVKAAEGIVDGLKAKAVGKLGRATVADGATDAKKFRLLGNFTFDPHDQDEMRDLNNTLYHYGYCLHLDAKDDAHVPAWSPAQCTSPNGNISQVTHTASLTNPPKDMNGILYRPMLSHRLVVMYNPDPINQPSAWRRARAVSVQLPNAAPTFVVGVERALFTERTTDLTFDAGVLSDVVVTKGSELDEFVSMPLRLAQLIVSFPAQVLQIRVNRTTNVNALLQAQQNQLKALELLQEQEKQQLLLTNFESVDPDAATLACLQATKEASSEPGQDERLQACTEHVSKTCNTADPETKDPLICAQNYYENN